SSLADERVRSPCSVPTRRSSDLAEIAVGGPAGVCVPRLGALREGRADLVLGCRVIGSEPGPHERRPARRTVRAGARECDGGLARSEAHTSELQSREKLVCRLLLE